MANFTDKQLDAWRKVDWRKVAGNWERTVRALIDEVTALRLYVRSIEPAYLEWRERSMELERQAQPAGRVLVIECPPEPDTREIGETILFADGKLDLCVMPCPVDGRHAWFADVLQAVLKLETNRVPARFQRLPGEATCRVRRIDHYPRDPLAEVEALLTAQLTEDVLQALGEIRAEHEAKTIRAQDAAPSEEPIEANAVETQEHEAAADGGPAPQREAGVPW